MEAYETLLDPVKKRRYDSTRVFNDSIPEKFDASKEDFYEVFDQVFKRNAFFSKIKPVPKLGTSKDSINKVLNFYKFWDNFESWREFQHDDEYDLAQAEDRYERRYMEQNNRRLKAPLIKNEKIRINKLSNLAYKNDPRIKEMIEKQEKEKIQKREMKKSEKILRLKEKEDQSNKKKKEENRILQEEILKQQIIKDQLLEKKKIRKDLESKLEEKLKKLQNSKHLDSFYFEDLFLKIHNDDFEEVFKFIEQMDTFHQESFHKHIVNIRVSKNQTSNINELNKAKIDDKDWTQEDINQLSKAIIRYPAGVSDRWNKVAQLFNGKFSESELATKAKELKTYHKNELNIKTRETKETKTEIVINDKKTEEIPKVMNKDIWTKEQQALLEMGIKKYPTTMDAKDRWEKIASEISGKSMKDCVERFKWIKEQLQKKKTN